MAVFDEFASEYDNWYQEKKGSFIDKVETELALKLLKINKGIKILDIGCGTGNFSCKLAKIGCSVIGVDISEEMLSVARRKAAEQNLDIEFIKMDAIDLKFADNEFDVVISMAAFEFIKDISKVMDEIFRVVKVGGQVLVGTINGDSDWGKFYKSKEMSENSVFKFAHFRTIHDLKKLKPDNLVRTGECLFVSPLAGEEEFNMEQENKLASIRKGGFICALWRK